MAYNFCKTQQWRSTTVPGWWSYGKFHFAIWNMFYMPKYYCEKWDHHILYCCFQHRLLMIQNWKPASFVSKLWSQARLMLLSLFSSWLRDVTWILGCKNESRCVGIIWSISNSVPVLFQGRTVILFNWGRLHVHRLLCWVCSWWPLNS